MMVATQVIVEMLTDLTKDLVVAFILTKLFAILLRFLALSFLLVRLLLSFLLLFEGLTFFLSLLLLGTFLVLALSLFSLI